MQKLKHSKAEGTRVRGKGHTQHQAYPRASRTRWLEDAGVMVQRRGEGSKDAERGPRTRKGVQGRGEDAERSPRTRRGHGKGSEDAERGPRTQIGSKDADQGSRTRIEGQGRGYTEDLESEALGGAGWKAWLTRGGSRESGSEGTWSSAGSPPRRGLLRGGCGR